MKIRCGNAKESRDWYPRRGERKESSWKAAGLRMNVASLLQTSFGRSSNGRILESANGLSDYNSVREIKEAKWTSGFHASNTCATGLRMTSGWWKGRRWQVHGRTIRHAVSKGRAVIEEQEEEEDDDRDETLCRLSFKSPLELFTGAAQNLFRMHMTEGEVPDRVNALSLQRCHW